MKFNSFLANFKNQKRFPHALLLEANGCNDYELLINWYLKSLTCEENLFCNECTTCQKINKNCYIDLIIIDCSSKQLSKDQVLNIQNNFCYSATEKNNIKLYVIINIENSNKEAINSLLKFLEEPPINTYALFFCKNQTNVLNTIKSRCQKINITNENNINDDFINYCFNSWNEYKAFIDEFELEKEKQFFEELVINKDTMNQVDFINKIKNSTNEHLLIFIRMIAYFCTIEKKLKICELQKNINLNINKYLLAHKILYILEN